MNIISWNVNGIRAVHRKGNFSWLVKKSPDIFCLQEVKANPDQLLDEMKTCEGYESYFDWSKIKKGYSGVAVYSKIKPEKVDYGMGIKEFDEEGRLLGLYFKDFVLFNVYFPNGGGGPVRLDYKLRFYDAFLEYIEKVRRETGKKIIFCGDINTAHEAIDLARPKENQENTGFLPEERAWLDAVVNHGYIDTFRKLYPQKVLYTYWDQKSAARERNVGWRIDYFFVSPDMQKQIIDLKTHTDVLGSDHCPIELVLK
jgi:exodeoxyribonuclease-3